jgi:hypothetical protein
MGDLRDCGGCVAYEEMLDLVAEALKLASEIDGELNKLQHALLTIERSGAPGATICSQRTDGHACGWCRGMLTPCPVMIARTALEKHSTRLTDEPVNSGSCNDDKLGEKCDQS